MNLSLCVVDLFITLFRRRFDPYNEISIPILRKQKQKQKTKSNNWNCKFVSTYETGDQKYFDMAAPIA